MIVQPRIRGFICVTAHPTGLDRLVAAQADHAASLPLVDGPRRVLVLGSSMGYGLATRSAAAFAAGAATYGVCFEKAAEGKRTATAGWYNTAAFHRRAAAAGLYARSVNGDAFSAELKGQVVAEVAADLGTVDLVVYSLAAPRRTLPDGRVAKSALKPIGAPYRNKTIDVESASVSEVVLEPAEGDDVADTVSVMGGEDWRLWIDALEAGGVLAEGVKTLAYSYLGPELTFPIYRQGTIGRAKDHLEETARKLDARLRSSHDGAALVSINKAVVTQSSSAIPVVPLYITLLFSVMKRQGLHEGCGEQMVRMLHRIYGGGDLELDDAGRLRLDDWEMRPDVQAEVERRWQAVDGANVAELADLAGYRQDFLQLFGFAVDGVDYDADVDVDIPW